MHNTDLGSRLRAVRLAKKKSLRSLASEIGVSPSLLSQIETGKSMPSVETLYHLVQRLDTSIDYVMGHEGTFENVNISFNPVEDFFLYKLEETPSLQTENGVKWEKLAQLKGLDVETLRVRYQPNSSSSVEGNLMKHFGYEHVVMTSGRLTLHLEFDEYTLNAGDSVAFNSQRPHLFLNQSEEMAVGIWFMYGRNSQMSALENTGHSPWVKRGETIRGVVDVLRAFRNSEDTFG